MKVEVFPCRGKWCARIKCPSGDYLQLLEVYEGEEGKRFWLDRLKHSGLEVVVTA